MNRPIALVLLALWGCSADALHAAPTLMPAAPSLVPRSTASATIASLTIHLEQPAIPLGQSGTFSVIARDAAGKRITGTFAPPIVLHATHLDPATRRVTSSAGASDLPLSWVAGFSGASGSLTATAGRIRASATVPASSGFAYVNVGADPSTDVTGFQIVAGPDGDLYYGTLGPQVCSGGICSSTTGAIGTFDPKTHSAKQIALPSEVLGLLVSSDGALWIGGGVGHLLYRMPPRRFTTPAAIAVPSPKPPANANAWGPRMLAQDAQHRIWFGDGDGHRLLQVAASDPFGTIHAYQPPKGPAGTPRAAPYVNGLALGSDGNLYFADYDNGVLDRVDPSTGATTAQLLLPAQKTLGSSDSAAPRSVVADAATHRLIVSYFGYLTGGESPPPPGGLAAYAYGSSLSGIALPASPAGTVPDSLSQRGSYLYFDDLVVHAVGVIDEKRNTTRIFPTMPYVTPSARFSPNGIAAMADGTAWFTCDNATTPFQPLCLGHTVYLPRWSLVPGPSLTVDAGTAQAQIVGIMEAPSADSGPFTVRSSKPRVCRITHAADHNFVITGQARGTCTVTVTDRTHRAASLRVAVP